MQDHDAHVDDLHVSPLEDYIQSEPEAAGMHPGWILAILAAVGVVCFMLLDGLKSETYYYEVHDAVAQGTELVGQQVRIKGIVEEGTIVGEDGKLGRTFSISERGKSLRVTYDRALPDTFEEGVEVVALGTVDSDYVLVADEVLVKCPSRYEGGAPTGGPNSTGPTVN